MNNTRARRRTSIDPYFPNVAYNGRLGELPTRVLREYERWYVANEQRFLDRLEEEVRASSPGLTTWRANRSVKSLLVLDRWLVDTCGIRMSARGTVHVRTRRSLIPIEIDPVTVLQRRSIVPVFCLGVYFGAVLKKRHPGLRDLMYFKTSGNAMHGEMLLSTSKELHECVCPTRAMHLVALSVRDKDRVRNGATVRSLFLSCDRSARTGKVVEIVRRPPSKRWVDAQVRHYTKLFAEANAETRAQRAKANSSGGTRLGK